ncbi:WD repeat-containing protein jip5 [Penicillium hispanicum]|uniref:WD repeat-containing protein jip5 n=1 Tax=Penicillium hispanicum TaxID=1080232 RepID=UPI00253FD8B0|nr:WD repeat-containing protein jip5 [Penicillium hispanicum]KAJ5569946.1 WD repeat-containing protein jip5 [Penicillium hispanicum]
MYGLSGGGQVVKVWHEAVGAGDADDAIAGRKHMLGDSDDSDDDDDSDNEGQQQNNRKKRKKVKGKDRRGGHHAMGFHDLD